MENIQVFNFEEKQVRTVLVNNKPFFVGEDVAETLGYTNSRKAIQDNVDEDDKGVTKCDTLGGK